MIMPLLLALLGIILLYVTYERQRVLHLISVGEKIAKSATPFSRPLPKASLRIAIVGDSTGVGAGTSAPQYSLAGLLGAKYPQAEVVNVAAISARTWQAIEQIKQLTGHFDLIFINVGGNDNVHFTSYIKLESNIRHVLQLAVSKASHVLLTTPGNVGTVPLLPWALRWIFTIRSQFIRRIFITAVEATNGDVQFVDLYRDASYDPFALEPKKYYAQDLFHPSDAGYADWFLFISKQLDSFEL